MPAGPFNPTEAEDVSIGSFPVNAATQPTSGPFNWTLSDATAGSLAVASDTKSCKLVTNPGAIDCVITVTDSVGGLSDTAAVSRGVVPPPVDNVTTAFNLSGSVVPK